MGEFDVALQEVLSQKASLLSSMLRQLGIASTSVQAFDVVHGLAMSNQEDSHREGRIVTIEAVWLPPCVRVRSVSEISSRGRS